jgi:hypothetical protein
MTTESPGFFQVDSLLEKIPIHRQDARCSICCIYTCRLHAFIYEESTHTCIYQHQGGSEFSSHSGIKKPVGPVAARPSNRESQSTTYVEYRAVSGVFQNILPPTPFPPSEFVLPPHQSRAVHEVVGGQYFGRRQTFDWPLTV